ncbi:unnamed protein product, partial [Cyprideis torosa]
CKITLILTLNRILCVLLIGKASCPGRYEAVSYQLGSERKESCYFVSTDYVRWEDGTLFCSRHHGGYLAEFVYLAEWEAFKSFFTNIPKTTKAQLYDTHVWIGASHVIGRNVWKWNGSEADFSQIVPRSQIPELELTPLKNLPEGDSYGLTVNVYSGDMEPYIFRTLSCIGCPTMHSYVCETDQAIDKEPLSLSATECQRDLQDGARDLAQCHEDLEREKEEAKKMSQNLTVCEVDLELCGLQALGLEDDSENLAECEKNITEVKNVISLKEQTISSLQEKLLQERGKRISSLEEELQKTKLFLWERDQMISFLQRELEIARKTTELLIPKMTFAIRKSDYQNGEAKSSIVEAGGLRWWVSFWVPSNFNRLLIHAEGGRGVSVPWTLTTQFLTLKIFKKEGREEKAHTNRLERATFSSDKGVAGMLPGWTWSTLTHPSWGFIHSQETLHMEVSFEGVASMSLGLPPQRPTVWEAEAILQLREFTSSLKEDGDGISSRSVHVGGFEWRAWVRRRSDYAFGLKCSLEKKEDWTLRVDWSMILLSAEGGGRNEETKGNGVEVRRGLPLTFGCHIRESDIHRFLTDDTAKVAVKIRVHH